MWSNLLSVAPAAILIKSRLIIVLGLISPIQCAWAQLLETAVLEDEGGDISDRKGEEVHGVRPLPRYPTASFFCPSLHCLCC